MFHSQAEQIVRTTLEETGATFTEEQIQAISIIVVKIVSRTVEEAFANWSAAGGSGGNKYFA